MRTYTQNLWMPTVSITRPANTTPYANGDAVGTASGSRLQFNIPHMHGLVKTARLWKTSTGTTADDFRLLLFSKQPTNNPADNAAPTTSFIDITDKDSFVGMIDFETGVVLAAGVYYEGQDYVPSNGIPFHLNGTTPTVLWGILTVLAAYEPGSAEVFTLRLQIDQ